MIATTVALIAVLLPLLFLGGLTGRLFREFGATLAGAVAISALVALTLTPMLSSRLLKRHDNPIAPLPLDRAVLPVDDRAATATSLIAFLGAALAGVADRPRSAAW